MQVNVAAAAAGASALAIALAPAAQAAQEAFMVAEVRWRETCAVSTDTPRALLRVPQGGVRPARSRGPSLPPDATQQTPGAHTREERQRVVAFVFESRGTIPFGLWPLLAFGRLLTTHSSRVLGCASTRFVQLQIDTTSRQARARFSSNDLARRATAHPCLCRCGLEPTRRCAANGQAMGPQAVR